MNRKQKKLVAGIAAAILILLVGFILTSRKAPVENEPLVLEQSSSSVSVSSDETLPSSSDIAIDPNYALALSNLDKGPRIEGEELEKVKATFAKAQQFAKTTPHPENIEPHVTNGLGMTDAAVAQTFVIALTANEYSINLDKLEVYNTEYNDVYQFLCVLEAKGKDPIYYIGNINHWAQQINLVDFYGGSIGNTYG